MTIAPDRAAPDDETVDLLVIGAGAAGMTAALVGAMQGLRVLLCEKTDQVGGTTATSAGTVWIPGSTQSRRAGVADDIAAARAYLRSVIGDGGSNRIADVRHTFLDCGPHVIDALEAKTDVAFVAAAAHPDYLGNHPGAAYGGRALVPLPFDGRLLGADFARVRPPRPEFMVLGGMMVAKTDIPALLQPFASLTAFCQALRLLARHGMDRLRYRRGTRLVMGNALVARLLRSLRRQQVPLAFGAALVDLVMQSGRVVGATIEAGGRRKRVSARNGVVLATGGIGWNTMLRQRLFPASARPYSLSPAAITGDGIDGAERVGAALDGGAGRAGLWMPVSRLRQPDGTEALFPHIVLDRAKPGLLAVNASGRRFVNEADSYHAFVEAMLADDKDGAAVPAYLICDRSFITDYGIGFIHPGTRALQSYLDAGYLIEAPSASDLAVRIGVDPQALMRTIIDYNRSAEDGVDEAFGRGGSDLNRFNGDPANRPNPCLRPIGRGALYAVAVWPADLAGSAGLAIDSDSRVLRSDGSVIDGLYACGNDAVSIFEGTYPGPGTTLGPALVFGWRAAMHAVRCSVADSAES
jgi:3-oxosteroid 1-dehydrogenase